MGQQEAAVNAKNRINNLQSEERCYQTASLPGPDGESSTNCSRDGNLDGYEDVLAYLKVVPKHRKKKASIHIIENECNRKGVQ